MTACSEQISNFLGSGFLASLVGSREHAEDGFMLEKPGRVKVNSGRTTVISKSGTPKFVLCTDRGFMFFC